MPTRSKFAIFQGFLTVPSNALKFRSIGGGMCMLFEICEKRPFQKCMGWGGGRWSQFCTKSCKRTDTQGTGNALRITHYSESDRCHRCAFPQGPGIHRRRCRLPDTHVVKPWWGALYDPKTGMQRQWPLQWTESGVLCGSRQVAANRLYEAFWPAGQAPGSPSPNLHPQSVLFFAPKVSVVHQGKQQHVA